MSEEDKTELFQGIKMTIDELRNLLDGGSKHLPEEQKEWVKKLIAELEQISNAGVICDYVPAFIAGLSLKVKELSDANEELSEKYKWSLQHSFIAPRDLQEARVRIYDIDGEDRKWPRAVIQRPDPNIMGTSYIDQETIDIIRTVRNDPLSIRHPAILLAIYRWQELIRHFYRLPSNTKKVQVRAKHSGQEVQYERGVPSRNIISRIAEAHLQNLAKAFLEGAKERALPKEVALEVFLHANGNIDTSHRCLHIAWQLLVGKAIKSKRSVKAKIALLEKQLHSVRDKLPSLKIVVPEDYSGPEPDPVQEMIAPILEFLESENGRSFLTSRKNWSTIKAAFDDWYLVIDKTTLRKYRSEAKKKSTGEEIDDRWIYATQPMSSMLMFSKIIDWDSLYNWFIPPTLPTSQESEKA